MKTTASSRTQKLIAVGAVVALVVISLQAYALISSGAVGTTGKQTARGGGDPAVNGTISVTGDGEVNIQPDRAILSFGVTTQDTSAQVAAQENSATMNSVISALEAIGINSSSIQTTSYNINPETDYANGAQFITGYQVVNEVQATVQVSDASLGTLGARVGEAIDAAAGQGANEINGIQFTASDSAIQQATNQALQAAAQDAAGQAKVVAAALGVSVLGVVSVDANPAYPSPVVYDGAVQGSASTPIVAPQTLQITASVEAVYSVS